MGSLRKTEKHDECIFGGGVGSNCDYNSVCVIYILIEGKMGKLNR